MLLQVDLLFQDFRTFSSIISTSNHKITKFCIWIYRCWSHWISEARIATFTHLTYTIVKGQAHHSWRDRWYYFDRDTRKGYWPTSIWNILRTMIHGPCGPINPNSTCIVNGRCSKHYLKQFCSETTIGENGYVIYRRRNNGRVVNINNFEVDNRWVIPYNRDLTIHYDCHMMWSDVHTPRQLSICTSIYTKAIIV